MNDYFSASLAWLVLILAPLCLGFCEFEVIKHLLLALGVRP